MLKELLDSDLYLYQIRVQVTDAESQFNQQ